MMLWFLCAMAFAGDDVAVADPPAKDNSAQVAHALAHTVTITVAVESPDEVTHKLINVARDLGGYFTHRHRGEVAFKVPAGRRAELTEAALAQGLVLHRAEQAEDLSQQLLTTRTLLKSRESVLGKYFEIMIGAQFHAVLQVEQQITGLVQEIEGLKAQLNQLEHRLSFAVVTVRFQFKERRPPVRDGSSAFRWLNTVNLVDVLEAYQ